MSRSAELKFWGDLSQDAQKNELPRIRELAGKWAASLSTFTGVLSVVGVSLSPTALEKREAWVQGMGVVLLLTILLTALNAIRLAVKAAQGEPTEVGTAPERFRDYWRNTVAQVATDLRSSRWWTIGAVSALVAYGVLMILTSDQKAPEATFARVYTSGATYCGTLIYDDKSGQINVKPTAGAVVNPPPTITEIEMVQACPKPATSVSTAVNNTSLKP